MAVDFTEIKRLRELTGVGMTDAKKALDSANGDFDKALSEMRKKGLTKAEKRGEQEARAGVIGTYLHDNRIGVIVEVNSETDFVARNEMFTTIVKDVAMHIAATNPEYVSVTEINDAAREEKRAEFTEKVKAEGKPETMVPQIVEGMLKKHFAEKCLLEQPFIKNPDQTVDQYLKENIAKLGENIIIRRFSRMALGEIA